MGSNSRSRDLGALSKKLSVDMQLRARINENSARILQKVQFQTTTLATLTLEAEDPTCLSLPPPQLNDQEYLRAGGMLLHAVLSMNQSLIPSKH